MKLTTRQKRFFKSRLWQITAWIFGLLIGISALMILSIFGGLDANRVELTFNIIMELLFWVGLGMISTIMCYVADRCIRHLQR